MQRAKLADEFQLLKHNYNVFMQELQKEEFLKEALQTDRLKCQNE